MRQCAILERLQPDVISSQTKRSRLQLCHSHLVTRTFCHIFAIKYLSSNSLFRRQNMPKLKTFQDPLIGIKHMQTRNTSTPESAERLWPFIACWRKAFLAFFQYDKKWTWNSVISDIDFSKLVFNTSSTYRIEKSSYLHGYVFDLRIVIEIDVGVHYCVILLYHLWVYEKKKEKRN